MEMNLYMMIAACIMSLGNTTQAIELAFTPSIRRYAHTISYIFGIRKGILTPNNIDT